MFNTGIHCHFSRAILFSIFALVPSIALANAPTNPDADLPPPKVIGAPTILVFQGPGVQAKVIFQDGSVVTTGNWGAPLTHPLAYALNHAHPGDVIGCAGVLEGMQIGKYDPNKPYAVYWAGGAVIRDISIVSIDPLNPAIIGDIGLMGHYLTPGGSGVDDFTLQNVQLRNSPTSGSPFMVCMNNLVGLLRLYHVKFIDNGAHSWAGLPMKWGIRAQGRARYDLRNIEFAAPAEEHSLYLDSPGSDGMGDSYFLDITQSAPTGRTGIQIVNRKDPNMAGGPTGLGNLYFRRLKLWTVAGGGGSGLTVAGHLGGVYVRNLQYKGNLGAVVFWSDAGKGLHLTPDGFTCPFAQLENIIVDSPNADRSHVAIKGVKHTIFKNFKITGNKAAIDLDNPYGGPVYNGTVEFQVTGGGLPLSQFRGFKSAQKIRKNNATLTDMQIDQLWPNP